MRCWGSGPAGTHLLIHGNGGCIAGPNKEVHKEGLM